MGLRIGWPFKRSRRCRICGDELRPLLIPECHGQYGEVSIMLINLPAVGCGSSYHPVHYHHPDLGAKLTDEVFYEGDLPVSRRTFFGRPSCFRCSARLRGYKVGALEISGTVELFSTSMVEIQLCAPGTRCTECGLAQILANREIGLDLSNAIVAAFESVSLKP